jgi:uncharacterized protein YndB with AHSA1/START domain
MTIHLTITINAPATKVFTAITDLPSYSTWLPPSSAFKGTTQISDTPTKLGTTYLEPGPTGLRKGEIVEFEEPTKVTFHQPMSMKPYFLGIMLDVRVEIRIKEDGAGTVVERDVLVDNEFRRDSWRTLELLQKHLESVN